MQDNNNQTNQKDPDNRGLDEAEMLLEQLRSIWWPIKNDYRTLIGLEDADLIDIYTAIDEDEDNE